MKQISIRMPDDVHKALKYLAVDKDQSINDILLDMIQEKLNEQKKEAQSK